MPEDNKTPLLAPKGLGEVICAGDPIELMAHPGGFWIVAVVDAPSQIDSGTRVGEAASDHVWPAPLRGGISVAGGNSAFTNGSITTNISSIKAGPESVGVGFNAVGVKL
jgi:hypothetical protein